MRSELIVMALAVGLCTWGFRFLPTKLNLTRGDPEGLMQRLLAATGPAAIATLFTASILPMLSFEAARWVPLVLGVAAVVGAFVWRGSVAVATMAGAAAYGLGFWVMGGA